MTGAPCSHARPDALPSDDRIGLLGANGNGKSTFAKLIGGRLAPMAGKMVRAPTSSRSAFSPSIRSTNSSPAARPTATSRDRMRGAPEAKIRAPRGADRLFRRPRRHHGRQLSGGEKARLLMGLATFDGPQLLILDEPTNHLDIDSRAELIEAINDYEGACILVSHDRRLLEACVDRLWLVGERDGKRLRRRRRRLWPLRAQPDHARTAKNEAGAVPKARAGASRGQAQGPLKRELAALEDKVNRFQDLLRRIDQALAKASASGGDALKIADLAQRRGDLERALASTEIGMVGSLRAGRGAVTAIAIRPATRRPGYRFAAAS